MIRSIIFIYMYSQEYTICVYYTHDLHSFLNCLLLWFLHYEFVSWLANMQEFYTVILLILNCDPRCIVIFRWSFYVEGGFLYVNQPAVFQ